ncbi:conjugative transposon protein TraK [Pedobacter endophyticus]|uniref:Conjugative transposon protein TraK n=2 Tax=Pedobacter endophyticus TaxID=2789740 RepID=A0A7S9L3G8_9SPHI|nr:conjugative transposon protein TraK [Pedobacter endophyticus]QPH41776.1 conjugative transposon protein TraK [Pedobacter endophyticus]
MMIKSIESKIRLATFLSLGSFVLCFAIVATVSFFAYGYVRDSRKSIYILDPSGTPILAKQTDVQLNRAAEYRAHIAKFHSLFFSLVPDEKFIEYQMKQAMYLVDESGALQYNNLKEKGFFSSILSSSAVLTLRTDSIFLDEKRMYFRYYGTQKIDRRSSSVTRSLITEGSLIDLEIRSDNNPHAVLITRWKTLENRDISTTEKNAFQ